MVKDAIIALFSGSAEHKVIKKPPDGGKKEPLPEGVARQC
jgi:hypothetical protein